jgi:hypothetical protein
LTLCLHSPPIQTLDITIDADLWGESLRERGAIKKRGAGRKFLALALVDSKDRVYENRNVSVKYEIFKGGCWARACWI